jgi:hypothetical protein
VKQRLNVSVSGGKTSGKMAHDLWTGAKYRDQYEMVFTFANTGEENDATLELVRKMEQAWGMPVVWLESVPYHGSRKASGHRIVTFETASRKGQPFEDMIRKYGIPNKAYPHCTRELKLNPIKSYLSSIGWEPGSYVSAVGIRADEPKRIRADREKAHIVYPLFHWFPTTKPEINDWWEEQPFNLEIKEHQGNCKWCWKKSLRKHALIAFENPEFFEFPARMEEMYGLAGHNEDGTKRVFFRGNLSTKALLQIVGAGPVHPRYDDPDLDSGCSESCEAFGVEVDATNELQEMA